MKKSLFFALFASVLVGAGWHPAIAQQTPTPSTSPATTDTEDEALDDAIVRFGYTSGAAYQCSSSSQAVDIEQNSLRAFTGITRLFGSDRAFFYAASYGSGANDQIDRNSCPQYIRQFQEAIQNNRSRQGE